MSTYKKPGEPVSPGEFDNCPDFLEAYLRYLIFCENKAVSTVTGILTNLREYCQYVHFTQRYSQPPHTKDAHRGMDISVMELQELCLQTEEDLERYLCFCDTVAGTSTATIRKRLSLLRQFFSYLERNAQDLGIAPYRSPTSRLCVPSSAKASAPVLLSLAQIQRLYNAATGVTMLRDRALILLMVVCNLTLAEISMLDHGDLEDATLRIRSTGVGSDRFVYLTPAAQDALESYLQEQGRLLDQDASSALILASDFPRRMTPKAMAKRLTVIAKAAGMTDKKVTPQVLRDSGVALMLRTDASEEECRQLGTYLGYKGMSWAKRLGKASARDMVMRSAVAALGEDE